MNRKPLRALALAAVLGVAAAGAHQSAACPLAGTPACPLPVCCR